MRLRPNQLKPILPNISIYPCMQTSISPNMDLLSTATIVAHSQILVDVTASKQNLFKSYFINVDHEESHF